MEDLSFSQQAEKTNRLSLESELEHKMSKMEVRLGASINKGLDSLGTQLSQSSEKISRAQDQIDRLDRMQQEQEAFLSPVEQFHSLGHKKSYDQPPSQIAKGESMEDMMARVKTVWPKDDIYIKKGSTGSPVVEQRSGEGKSDPSPDSANVLGLELERDQSKFSGRSRSRKYKTGRNVSKSPSSDRSLSPLPPKMQFFSGDPTKGSWSSFIIKFERTADRHKWSDGKKLDRLFGCLNDKALEYAVKCKNNQDYDNLKKSSN